MTSANVPKDDETKTLFRYELAGAPLGGDAPVVVWAHGWGQNLEAFRGLSSSFNNMSHVLIDFPGFGQAPPPPTGWGTDDYADASERFLYDLVGPNTPVIWIGHSFGCRVGVQMGARHPQRIAKMCLIAGAGLKRKRTFAEQVRFEFRKFTAKLVKNLPMPDSLRQSIRMKMGSADYRTAGAMRGVFVKVVNEDLTELAKTVTCQTLLIYGENDTETPPEMGERYSRLIPNAKLEVLSQQDHYTVLSSGRHLVAKRIAGFVGSP